MKRFIPNVSLLNISYLAIFVGFFLPIYEFSSAEVFSGQYKAECRGDDSGCPCFEEQDEQSQIVKRLFHLQPFEGTSGNDETKASPGANLTSMVELKLEGGDRCFYPTKKLRPIYWANTNCPDEDSFADLPFPDISSVLKKGSQNGQKLASFKTFPTFYYVADEAFYKDTKTENLYEGKTGKLLATVNADYRIDLDIQGTGRLNDGRVLNVWQYKNSIWDYVVLPKGSFGLGIRDHYLYPFRTVAIDFSYLCKKSNLAGCTGNREQDKRNFVGSLLHIAQLEGTPLPNGKIHDGYVCAHDVGGAIKQDRIDLFVGTMGGGNPYLPKCRSENAYTKHGIESLVPYDWRLFDENGRVRPYEYRTVSPSKGLDVRVVKGAKCKNLW